MTYPSILISRQLPKHIYFGTPLAVKLRYSIKFISTKNVC